jgi:hypothetical protein
VNARDVECVGEQKRFPIGTTVRAKWPNSGKDRGRFFPGRITGHVPSLGTLGYRYAVDFADGDSAIVSHPNITPTGGAQFRKNIAKSPVPGMVGLRNPTVDEAAAVDSVLAAASSGPMRTAETLRQRDSDFNRRWSSEWDKER